jgi:hypothetical protein
MSLKKSRRAPYAHKKRAGWTTKEMAEAAEDGGCGTWYGN